MIKKEKEHNIDGFSLQSKRKIIRYNSDQMKAINELNKSIDSKNFKPHLLHGVTGSGKTEVFIEIIKRGII